VRLSGATGVIGISLRDMPMGFGGECEMLRSFIAPVYTWKNMQGHTAGLCPRCFGTGRNRKTGSRLFAVVGRGRDGKRGWYGKSAQHFYEKAVVASGKPGFPESDHCLF